MALSPQPKPSVAVTGTGADRTYTDTRTGQTYNEPSYSAFSVKGLTSTDPANVARNRAGAAKYANIGSGGGGGGSDLSKGIASLPKKAADDKYKPLTDKEKRRLAQIGAPTNKPRPVEVATPVYGLAPGMTPSVGYGTVFQGLQPMAPPDLGSMDIFAAYPDFTTYMTPQGNPYYGMYPGFGLPPMFGTMA